MSASIWSANNSPEIRDIVSVKDFGATGDGSTDDTEAIQNAAQSMTEGGMLVFPFGVYKILHSIEFSAGNIRVVGDNATIDATELSYDSGVRGSGAAFRFVSPEPLVTTTLTSTAAAGTKVLTVVSSAGMAVGDIIRSVSTQRQYENAGAVAYFNDQNKIVKISGSNITLETALSYALTVSPYTVTVTAATPLVNISVEGFTFLGGGYLEPLANGLGQVGVWGSLVDNFVIRLCKFYRFQGIACAVDRGVDFIVDSCYFEGIDVNVSVVEGISSGWYGAYAIRCRRALFTNCTGIRMRHLFDGAEVYGFIQSNSIAANSHRAAFGSHEAVYDLLIEGNIARNCYSGVIVRAFTSRIHGNVLHSTETSTISTGTMLATDASGKLSITSNTFICDKNTVSAIYIVGIYDGLIISSNEITGALIGIGFTTQKISRISILSNTIDAPTGISVTYPTGNMTAFSGMLIHGNTFLNYTSNMVSLRGSQAASTPAEYIKITENLGIPTPAGSGNGILLRSEGYYGEYILIRGNSQWGDTSSVVSVGASPSPGLHLFKAYPTIEWNDETTKTAMGNRHIGYGTSGAAPTNATVFRGSLINDTTPSVGVPNYWIASASGTEGSIAGVTGDITAGTNTLVLIGNDATKAYNGSYITIAGAGVASADLTTRITGISDDFATVTIETAASTTVTGAAVTRFNPTFVAGANLV